VSDEDGLLDRESLVVECTTHDDRGDARVAKTNEIFERADAPGGDDFAGDGPGELGGGFDVRADVEAVATSV
jgi:hypothetical protein